MSRAPREANVPAPLRVEIDRIEVRLPPSTPSAAEPALEPEGPAVSLETYLERRRGGS